MEAPLRLVFVLHSGAIGGGPRFLRTLVRYLHGRGHHAQVIVDRDGPLADELVRDGIAVTDLPLASARLLPTCLPRLVGAIRRVRPQIVHLHGQPAGFWGALAARLAGVRRLVYSAQFPAFHADFDPWRRIRNQVVERVSVALASQVVCLSRADRSEFQRRRLAPPERLAHIPNCVDQAFFRAPSAAPATPRLVDLPVGASVVGFVGRLTDQKGVEDLIRALPLIRAARPEAHAVIAGEGPLRRALEALARTLAGDAATFTGALEDPLPVFQLSRVLVVPSHFEPLGIVAAEALALGKPVVATRVGGLPEIVEHEVTGLLIPPRDPAALAEAVCRLLKGKGLARDIGARGREMARRLFSEEAVLPRYERLYLELLDNRRATRA